MPHPTDNDLPAPRVGDPTIRVLITAGGTREPIDSVRYIGNRSSGRLGIGLAEAAAARGWRTTLLLGSADITPNDPRITLHRFRTTDDLADQLDGQLPAHDVLVMAAAVADFRPSNRVGGKIRRTPGSPLTLELEPTPDLLAAAAASSRADQLLVGFALEPADGLLRAARAKLERKQVDLIVANPIETLDSESIRATLVDAAGDTSRETASKPDFAAWLLDDLARRLQHKRSGTAGAAPA